MDRQDHAVSLATTLAGIALLSTGWCAVAFGGTGELASCDQAEKELQSLTVPVSELSVVVVDHSDVTAAEALQPQAGAGKSATPLLYLTPRVQTILRGMFDSDSGTLLADDAADAEAPLKPESAEKTAPVTLIDRVDEAPAYQQQMYRKDI
ncbi:MAG: hypothetical protein BMS9Abin32_317 [Gammaproteobacteria bacterium]|nr:MAG: hypothetical protein BMS9Abin32_317 [Gammaproteobacteria bacterium]